MSRPQLFEAVRRPLSDAERRLVRARIRNLVTRGRRGRAMSIPITGAIVLVLWALTMLASDAPRLVITAFWLVVGAGIALWSRRDMTRHEAQLMGGAKGLESALKRNEADVYNVRAQSFAEFDEVEDEGACYAFELPGNRVVFVVGQEFYESARFPSLDFSLVYVLDEGDRTVDVIIQKRGAKAKPARRISAAFKQSVESPEHLEVRNGTIDDLEAMFSRF
jgi:hypothetical protein